MQVPIWKFAAAAVLAVLLYLGSYISYREGHQELNPHDSKVYVIFPENRFLYYLFRPLTYVDGTLTDMQFHIGAHE